MTHRTASTLSQPLRFVFTLAFFVGLIPSSWAQFESRATRTVPGEAFSVASGDFNRDGKLDLAIMDGQLSVLLGNGDGTFKAPINYSSVDGLWIAAGDFNGDGIIDLIATTGASTVAVLLGNGDGTFQAPKFSSTTAAASFIAIGDFNGDRKLDIVVVDHPYVSVLLGNGDGTFRSPIDNNSFVEPEALAVGDFNNDGKLDVAVVGSFGGSANVGVLLGNGDGTFQPSLTYPVLGTPYSVSAADFNHDGRLDVAIGYEFQDVGILLGRGDGSFLPEVDYATYGGTGEVSVGDFDGDGKLDLAVSGAIPPGLNELLGNGDGTFQPARFFSAGRFSGALAVGDFNSDHRADVVYVDRTFGVITLLNTGALAFSPSTPLIYQAAQLVGTASPPQSVTLANSGTTAIPIRSIRSSGPFRTIDNCAGEVQPGTECTVSAVFEPESAGPQRGLIYLDDGASSKAQVVELSGRGTVVALSPGRMSFAPQKVGTRSSPQQLSITNDGTMPLTVSSISVGGADPKDFVISGAADCVGAALSQGSSCSASVVFSPKKTGERGAIVFVYDNGAGSPETAAVAGTGD